jgi:hypothetical protein
MLTINSFEINCLDSVDPYRRYYHFLLGSLRGAKPVNLVRFGRLLKEPLPQPVRWIG